MSVPNPSFPIPELPDIDDFVHELNNALAPIILSVEILRRRTADPDTQRQLDLMAGHAWRGAAVARRILAWAEGRGGKGGKGAGRFPRGGPGASRKPR